jgi:NAD(P)H-dependent FMN reductase
MEGTAMPMKLQVIVGSTRPDRASDGVMPWVFRRASAHEAFEAELLDLRDWPLPLFGEHRGSIGDLGDPTYSDPAVRRWNKKIAEGDAYLMVTPEYNHSVPGVLKNAIDSVFVSYAFRNKPMGAVGYSSGIAGGVRAIEHLAHIAIETELVPLRNSVILPKVAAAFGEDGEPADPMTEISMGILLDDLAWWGRALSEARARGQLPPGSVRARAALAAAG